MKIIFWQFLQMEIQILKLSNENIENHLKKSFKIKIKFHWTTILTTQNLMNEENVSKWNLRFDKIFMDEELTKKQQKNYMIEFFIENVSKNEVDDEFRKIMWPIMLEMAPIKAEDYKELVEKGATEEFSTIMHDIHRSIEKVKKKFFF
jgi:hypothetical protein